ncbi:protein of unknown function [Ferrimonas sediminum]|uniref:DUF4826 domain-containing protein n=1 Tax=Ferrimonas sediminum TaxID=718193 RepID=A0A1G8NEA9_9GAMM|nr:DUF4826 family protein [Ferrimonas sediminum]SDI78611.1 protein of unknown function [Ferrimonas sediminum]
MKEQQGTEEQRWIREQFQKANRHMAEKGLIPGKVLDKDSRILPPFVTLWKIQETGSANRRFWVISGDLPTDLLDAQNIPDAREALRHFALNWQLKAENILRTTQDKTQVEFANLMIARAESMATMHMTDRYWQQQSA